METTAPVAAIPLMNSRLVTFEFFAILSHLMEIKGPIILTEKSGKSTRVWKKFFDKRFV